MTSKSKQKIQQIQKFAYIPRKAKAKKKKKLLEIILLRRLNTEWIANARLIQIFSISKWTKLPKFSAQLGPKHQPITLKPTDFLPIQAL